MTDTYFWLNIFYMGLLIRADLVNVLSQPSKRPKKVATISVAAITKPEIH